MRSLLVAAMLAAGPAAAAPPAAHALLGTWEFDPGQSTFDGAVPYRSASIRFEAVPGGTHVVAHIVEGPGRVLHFEYVDAGDGTFAPVTGNPFYDAERTAWTARRAVRTERRAGVVTGTTTMDVTADGRSFVARADRTLPSGRRYRSLITWRRVDVR